MIHNYVALGLGQTGNSDIWTDLPRKLAVQGEWMLSLRRYGIAEAMGGRTTLDEVLSNTPADE